MNPLYYTQNESLLDTDFSFSNLSVTADFATWTTKDLKSYTVFITTVYFFKNWIARSALSVDITQTIGSDQRIDKNNQPSNNVN